MKRIAFLGLTLAIGLTLRPQAAQQPPAPSGVNPGAARGAGPGRGRGPIEISVTDVGNGVTLFSAGSNSVLVVGTDAAILVDTLLPNAEGFPAKVAAVTNRPIKYVLNTHDHADHTGNNEAFAKMGAIVVSTERAAAIMANPPAPGPNGPSFQPLAPAARPTEMFTGTKTVTAGGVRAVMTQVAPAHTEGDAFVYFPDKNVLAMGDLHHSNEYPVWTSSFEGNLQAYDAMLKIVNDQTKIVPGHGPVTNRRDVSAYIAMLRRVRDQIDALVKQGKTVDEVAAMQLLANDSTPYPGGPDNKDRFIQTLYNAEKTGQGK